MARDLVNRSPLAAGCLVAALLGAGLTTTAVAQVPPSASQAAAYQGLHAAAWRGDLATLQRLLAAGADRNATDSQGRTPLHVATFARQPAVIRALAKGAADLDRLENDRYDAVTIAAVADDEVSLSA